MLFGFMVTNFADKPVLGLSAVPVMPELQIDNTQFGLIGTGFFLFFSISAVLVGFLANRMSTTALLLARALFWSWSSFQWRAPVGLTALRREPNALWRGGMRHVPVRCRSNRYVQPRAPKRPGRSSWPWKLAPSN